MSKKDNTIIGNLQTLCLDMIKEAGSGDAGISLSGASLFYTLYMKHLKFNPKSSNWLNRDRVLVSNRFLPLFYATNFLFTNNYTLDNLREFKKFNSKTPGYASIKCAGLPLGSFHSGDIIAEGVGIALGERYLEELIAIEDKKSRLLDFKTYVICTMDDLMSGAAYESMSFASKEELSNIIFLVINDDINKDSGRRATFEEELTDRFISLNFEVDNINDNLSSIDGAIDDAKKSKKPSVIIINAPYAKDSSRENSNENFNMPLNDEDMAYFRSKIGITSPWQILPKVKEDIKKELSKRLDHLLERWDEEKEDGLADLKIKEIIEFLETKKIKLTFKADNIRINDNYEEELIISNNKILNILASKSPFILCGSDDNFIYTKGAINKTPIMSKNNPTGRNILFGSRTLAMGGVSAGLASLGFKVFISTPLIFMSYLKPYIKICTLNNLPVNFIFTQDSPFNTYEGNGYSSYEELTDLRSMENIINFRPADINEVLGMYEILANYHKTSAIILGSEKIKKLRNTNYKYLIAGAYRVKKERENVNAIIIATGTEVSLALKVADNLAPYGLDIRVVSMPSMELFNLQNEKYREMLLPKNIKTFVIEFGNDTSWYRYASGKDYILALDKYSVGGSKTELLNYYNLDMDSLKTRIISLMKK